MQYPSIAAGQRITGNLLRGLTYETFIKAGQDTRANTTYVADSELSGIYMDVGYYDAVFNLFVTGDTGGDIKTRWTFSGSWSNPIRFRFGPEGGSASSAVTQIALAGVSASNDAVYGLSSTAAFHTIREESQTIQVISAGNLALEFAKNGASAADTILRVQSSLRIKRIG